MQALMSMKDTIKQVVKDPQNIAKELFSRTYLSLLDKSPSNRKLQKMIQLERKAVIRILTRLVSVNLKSNLSETNSSDWLKVVKFLKENFSNFSILSPALVNAERLCEIKALIACSRSMLDDLVFDQERELITQRFVNKSYLKIKALYDEICYQEPVLEEFLASEKSIENSSFL